MLDDDWLPGNCVSGGGRGPLLDGLGLLCGPGDLLAPPLKRALLSHDDMLALFVTAMQYNRSVAFWGRGGRALKVWLLVGKHSALLVACDKWRGHEQYQRIRLVIAQDFWPDTDAAMPNASGAISDRLGVDYTDAPHKRQRNIRGEQQGIRKA